MRCRFCGSELDARKACTACGMPQEHDNSMVRWTTGDDDGEPLAGGTPLHDGRYQLLKVIGRGGFSYTYEAFDSHLNRPVAIKELFPIGSRRSPRSGLILPATIAKSGTDTHASFLREAALLRGIQHPNIVRVFDAFEQHGTAYMVMELLRGSDYSVVLDQRGAIPWREAIDIAREIGLGLEAAHKTGLVHRDIKPSNIMLTVDGNRVLIDFGAARSIGSQSSTLSKLVVTDGYSSPEQYGTQAVSAAADIYGLSATLFHLSTGQRPPSATDRLVHAGELNHPHAIDPSIPETFSNALMWGLQIQARDRPSRVSDLVSALTVGLRPTATPPMPTSSSQPGGPAIVETLRVPTNPSGQPAGFALPSPISYDTQAAPSFSTTPPPPPSRQSTPAPGNWAGLPHAVDAKQQSQPGMGINNLTPKAQQQLKRQRFISFAAAGTLVIVIIAAAAILALTR
jgi:serine/threonine protein kinase